MPPLLGQDRRERVALDELHHQVRGVLGAVDDGGGLAVVVHRGDAGVVQRRGRAGLGAEPVQELGVPAQLRLEHLDGDAAVQPGVRGLPDLAHAADGDPARRAGTARRGAGLTSASVSSPRPARRRSWPGRSAADSLPPVRRHVACSRRSRRPRSSGSRPARTPRTRRTAGCSSGRRRSPRCRSSRRSRGRRACRRRRCAPRRAIIMSRELIGAARRDRLVLGLRVEVVDDRQVGREHLLHELRAHPLAAVGDRRRRSTAFCSAVSRTSRWPMPVW